MLEDRFCSFLFWVGYLPFTGEDTGSSSYFGGASLGSSNAETN